MRELLERYAADYAAAEQMLSGHGDDQSIIHYPTVFLYIGDEAGQAIEPMIQMNAAKWENSAGVIYFHAASASGKGRQAASAAHAAKVTEVVLDGLSPLSSDHKAGRKELWEAFRGNAGYLADLNRALRGVSDTIADYGRLYASFDRLHLAVITRADDPMNALVPDISLLAQAIFQQSFKSVQMDLYTLISEREQMDTFAHASAIGVSFLRELEGMQRPDYTFSALLEVTGDGLAIPVVHPPSPLFDLVYVLSDRNEKGMTAVNGIRDNYDIICHIQLLKNRKRKDAQADAAYGGYNNSTFKNSLRTESGRQGFVSAGLSKVKRPNYSIALTVLYHLHMQLSELLAKEPELSMREKLACFGLDPASVDAMLTQLLPSDEQLADMTGLLTSGVRYEQLKPLSLRDAEEALFGDGASVFSIIISPARRSSGCPNLARRRKCAVLLPSSSGSVRTLAFTSYVLGRSQAATMAVCLQASAAALKSWRLRWSRRARSWSARSRDARRMSAFSGCLLWISKTCVRLSVLFWAGIWPEMGAAPTGAGAVSVSPIGG